MKGVLGPKYVKNISSLKKYTNRLVCLSLYIFWGKCAKVCLCKKFTIMSQKLKNILFNFCDIIVNFIIQKLKRKHTSGTEEVVLGFCSCPRHGTMGHRDKKISLSRDKRTTGRPVPWKLLNGLGCFIFVCTCIMLYLISLYFLVATWICKATSA